MSAHPNIARQLLALLIACVMLVESASADLVFGTYYDSAVTTPVFGGPVVNFVVDTVSNRVRLNTWTELPLHSSPEFWVPANPPLIWRAVDATGAEFDVPDSFGMGGVISFGDDSPANAADDFAFISPESMQAMDWHPFDDLAGEPDTNTIVNFTSGVPFFAGWGGFAFEHPDDGMIFLVSQPNPSSADEYDYTTMPAIPTSATGVGSSTEATVTITGRVVDNRILIIPEASSFAAFALLSGIGAANSLRRKRLRQRLP